MGYCLIFSFVTCLSHCSGGFIMSWFALWSSLPFVSEQRKFFCPKGGFGKCHLVVRWCNCLEWRAEKCMKSVSASPHSMFLPTHSFGAAFLPCKARRRHCLLSESFSPWRLGRNVSGAQKKGTMERRWEGSCLGLGSVREEDLVPGSVWKPWEETG